MIFNEIKKLFVKNTEPKNLDVFKQELQLYVNSGDYYEELLDEISICYSIIDNQFKYGDVIVFDMDETLISELSLMQSWDWGWNDFIIEKALNTINFPSLKPVLDFYTYCQNRDIPCYIITSRREKYRDSTVQCLSFAGYNNYKLILRQNKENDIYKTIQEFKIAQRKYIYSDNKRILINIGDQQTDLNGGYSENIIKLSNPFYLITEDM